MARIARLMQQGYPYHVTHRGNRRADIFFSDSDRIRYLGLLAAYSERYGLDLWAYCLMSNHVHLLACPRRDDSMALAIGNAHRAYSRIVNEQNGWTGHLWAGRYYSTLLDEEHLWAAARYVELNPVRAGVALRAVDYPWSSAPANARIDSSGLLSAERPFPGAIPDWAAWLDQGLDEQALARLRMNTSTGRPSAGAQLLETLERSHGRSLHPGRPGRRCRLAASSRADGSVPGPPAHLDPAAETPTNRLTVAVPG
jgi:putative transposase